MRSQSRRVLPALFVSASLAAAQSPAHGPVRPPLRTGPALPTWQYEVVSPVNGVEYTGYIVGTSPFSRGGRTTTVPVILVPFIVQFTNTTTGFTTTFDPSTAPDSGCTAGETAMSLVENSPIFQSLPWNLNGVDVGVTQYIDAFQRANFWQIVQTTGDDWHTLLAYTVSDPLTLPLSYASASPTAEVRVGVASSCTNPTGSGSTNAAGYQGFVDFSVLQGAMTGYILSHNITADRLPVFILYNVSYSQNGAFYLGGYHFSEVPYPQSLSSAGQTFIMADFRTVGSPPFDVSILSHEIAEWVNDPGGSNPTPFWGNIGDLTGCKRALEVGDALTQTDLPPIAGPAGFAYHLQDLAYFSWFFRTPSIAAGGAFSDNGTLTTNAGPVCQ